MQGPDLSATAQGKNSGQVFKGFGYDFSYNNDVKTMGASFKDFANKSTIVLKGDIPNSAGVVHSIGISGGVDFEVAKSKALAAADDTLLLGASQVSNVVGSTMTTFGAPLDVKSDTRYVSSSVSCNMQRASTIKYNTTSTNNNTVNKKQSSMQDDNNTYIGDVHLHTFVVTETNKGKMVTRRQ